MYHADPLGAYQTRMVGMMHEYSPRKLLARAAFMTTTEHNALTHYAVPKMVIKHECRMKTIFFIINTKLHKTETVKYMYTLEHHEKLNVIQRPEQCPKYVHSSLKCCYYRLSPILLYCTYLFMINSFN